MLLLDGITNDANQLLQVNTEDNYTFTLSLWFQELTGSWWFSFEYNDAVNDRTVKGNNAILTVMPNVLTQWKLLLPFGLACVSLDGTDPSNINDFVSGNILLYTLTQTDITEIDNV